jgi:hypothetical protein
MTSKSFLHRKMQIAFGSAMGLSLDQLSAELSVNP